VPEPRVGKVCELTRLVDYFPTYYEVSLYTERKSPTWLTSVTRLPRLRASAFNYGSEGMTDITAAPDRARKFTA